MPFTNALYFCPLIHASMPPLVSFTFLLIALLYTYLRSYLFKCVHISFSGLLHAVSNLRSESLVRVIRLTWNAPFSLDITGVDPDIWYHVDTIVNNDPFNTSSDSIPFNTYFVSTSEFNFTNNGTSTKNNVIYQFRVTPINGAGNGTTSAPVTGYFIGRELLLFFLLKIVIKLK